MKIIKNILLIALALLVQSTFLGRFDIYGVRPDLAMLVLLFIANTSGMVETILFGFFIGFLQDVYTPEFLGSNSLTMSLVGFFLGFVRERVTVEKVSVRFVVILLACIVHDMCYLFIYTQFDLSFMAGLFFRISLPGAFYTSILAVMIATVWEWAGRGGLYGVIRELVGWGR